MIAADRASPIACFGTAATTAWAQRLPADVSMVVADPGGFAGALVDLIARGLAGTSRDAAILPANPRALVLESVFESLLGQAQSHDAVFRAMDALAMGKLTINGETQAQLEYRFLAPEAAATFADLAITADRTFFRSFHELERAVAQYGYRPPRARIVTPVDPRVPLPRTGAGDADTRRDCIAVWAVGSTPAMLGAFEAACFDLRTQLTVIGDTPRHCAAVHPEGSHAVLESASAIVALADDPGTVYALSKFAKPLCAPVCGAAEIIENLYEFAPWNRVETVNAILQALRGLASAPLPAHGRLRFPTAPAIEVASSAPLVTIVMPTYSRPATLAAGLQRLAQQTYPNIEIVVVNNAGTPVGDVVANVPNARLIDRAENTGNATRPRNDGIASARGKYIALLDDDDVFFPQHVERMVHALEASRRDAAYSDFLVRFVDRAGDGGERVWGWDLQKPFGITSYELLVANRLGYLTVFMRRSLIERIGHFAEEVLGGEEVEYWLRIAAHVDFVHVAQPTTAYTVVRDWRGQLSEKSHALYAGGYEKVYERYPAAGLPLVQQSRAAYVASLRSTVAPPAMEPRYRIAAG